MRGMLSVWWLLLCVGCPEPATHGPIATPSPARIDMAPMDDRPDMPAIDAMPIDAMPADVGLLDAMPVDQSQLDAQVVDAAPVYDPCTTSEQRPHLELGPANGDAFVAWEIDDALPLIRLAQGGSVTRFDLLAVDVDAAAEGLSVRIVDLDDEQELAFGEAGALELPCRPGVGRLLVNQTIDYRADFAAADLLGRRVRIIVTLHTPTGDVFGGAEGILEAAQ